MSARWERSANGLSPQVRGNRDRRDRRRRPCGSIPAGAGEPPDAPPPCSRAPVYPRRCGGTAAARAGASLGRGLSPQVRGNRVEYRRADVADGSIPAGAGEPTTRSRPTSRTWVYPRRCGGTGMSVRWERSANGLSPQVRGNPGARGRGDPGGGSIPAGAGEPVVHGPQPNQLRVYPRRCGGTGLRGSHPGPA